MNKQRNSGFCKYCDGPIVNGYFSEFDDFKWSHIIPQGLNRAYYCGEGERRVEPVELTTSVLLLIDKSGRHSEHYVMVDGTTREEVGQAVADWITEVERYSDPSNAEVAVYYGQAMREDGGVRWRYMQGSTPDDIWTTPDGKVMHVEDQDDASWTASLKRPRS